MRGRSKGNWRASEHLQMLEIGTDISNSITSVAKDSYVIEIYEEGIEDNRQGDTSGEHR